MRWGAGGRIGSGHQGFSWIHLSDRLRIADLALGLDTDITLPDGVLIAASPNPVSNDELMSRLRRHLHRPGVPSPATLIKVGAMIMGTDPALALTGRYGTSTILSGAGFVLEFPDLESTIIDLTHDDTRRGRR